MSLRREHLYSVTITPATGPTLTISPVNHYQLPGVLWAAQKLHPGAAIKETNIGRGRIDPETGDAVDMEP